MKTKSGKVILCFFVVYVIVGLFLTEEGHAVPAAPVEHILVQADGTEFTARKWGDEWLNGWETTDAYTIVFDEVSQNWTYADIGADGSLVPSASVVGKDAAPPWIDRSLRPSGEALEDIQLLRSQQTEPQAVVPPTGTGDIPVLLIDFNDATATYTTGQFNTLLFGTGSYSMKDYFEEVSYGAFSVSAGPGGIQGWFRAANNHDYYGYDNGFPRAAELAREAVAAADAAGFDFAPYDQDGDCYVDVVDIVHQGDGTEACGNGLDIWSHRWSFSGAGVGVYTTNDSCPSGGNIMVNDYVIQPEEYCGGMTTMGVFAHEYGHVLGLPDLYDTDGSSRGIGNWSLMAGGSWNNVFVSGDRPAHADAWCKYNLGWVTPTLVSVTLINEPVTEAATTADVYQLLSGTPMSDEYFLVENRQLSGFDAGLPGPGLLIWHIDGDTIASKTSANTVNDSECWPGGPPCAADHYGVALVQADNLWNMEQNVNRGDTGDPFYSPANTSLTDSTSPNINLYDGSAGNVSVTNISASGSTMTATLTGICSVSFDDVPPGHWAESFIETIYCRSITSGCSTSPLLYCPDDSVTRKQMAVFIITAMGETPSGAAYDAYFDDIEDDGFALYINRMSELSITSGCGTRLYCPDATLTRAEMAVFIITAMGETPSGAAYDAYFDDIADDGFALYINKMSELSITSGCGTRLYCPDATLTRAEMAVFLVRAFP